MRTFWLAFGFFWAMSVGARDITIGSYNVENLWDIDPVNSEYESSAAPGRSLQYRAYAATSSNWYDPHIAAQKVRHLLHAIRLAGSPDILALQEIESAGNQSQVFEIPLPSGRTFEEELREMGYTDFMIGPQQPDQQVSVTTAFVSKLPLVEHTSLPIRFDRPSLAARDLQLVELMDSQNEYGRVFLINSHLPSARLKQGPKFRQHVAQTMKDAVDQLVSQHPSARVMMLGDFNASYWSEELSPLQITGDPLYEQDHIYDLWFDVDMKDRWEVSYQGRRSHVSHILLNPNLLKTDGLHYRPGSFRVVGQHDHASRFLLSAAGTPFRWQQRLIGGASTGYYEHIGTGYSDHLPLVATFSTASHHVRSVAPDVGVGDVQQPISSLMMMDQVRPCSEHEIRDYRTLDFTWPHRLEGTCVRLEFQEPVSIWMDRGGYPTVSLDETLFKSPEELPKVGLGMVRSFDYRPNLSDSRVTEREWYQADQENWSPKNPHPHSNKCYLDQVLRSGVGRLKKAVGRLGYTNGAFQVHVLSREPQHLEIVDLPYHVARRCDWNG